MSTITKAFSEMYGNNGKLSSKRANISANNMLKNISPNESFNNNNGSDIMKDAQDSIYVRAIRAF